MSFLDERLLWGIGGRDRCRFGVRTEVGDKQKVRGTDNQRNLQLSHL